MAIGVLVYLASDAVVVTTSLKIAFLVIDGVGCYLLSRSFKIPPALALVACVATPLNGFTAFFDAPSWVTGQLAWALLPYLWMLLKLTTDGRRSPFWAFVIGYFIVTIGYVAGTVAVRVRTPRCRNRFLDETPVGVPLVMVSVVVFLARRVDRGSDHSERDYLIHGVSGVFI